jgi:hypothetical protein
MTPPAMARVAKRHGHPSPGGRRTCTESSIVARIGDRSGDPLQLALAFQQLHRSRRGR